MLPADPPKGLDAMAASYAASRRADVEKSLFRATVGRRVLTN